MAITILLAIATCPVLADGGGHLWFYSQDPDTIPSPAPQPLPNPDPWDPKYQGVDVDPWKTEGIVIPPDEWVSPLSMWLACAQFESLNTKLVLSINDAAAGAIETISVDVNADGSVEATLDPDTPGDWDTSGDPPGTPPDKLAPHGVFNSAEFFGYAEVDVGNLYSPPGSPYAREIEITIELKDGVEVPPDAKIHFDAYGFTEDESFIFSPYSHDATFVVPELGVLLLATASFSALGLYAIKRRKSSN